MSAKYSDITKLFSFRRKKEYDVLIKIHTAPFCFSIRFYGT